MARRAVAGEARLPAERACSHARMRQSLVWAAGCGRCVPPDVHVTQTIRMPPSHARTGICACLLATVPIPREMSSSSHHGLRFRADTATAGSKPSARSAWPACLFARRAPYGIIIHCTAIMLHPDAFFEYDNSLSAFEIASGVTSPALSFAQCPRLRAVPTALPLTASENAA